LRRPRGRIRATTYRCAPDGVSLHCAFLLLTAPRVTKKPTRKPLYDCAKCPGYCCSYPRIAVSEFDIERLARHFGLSVAAARRKFTYHYRTQELDEQLLRHKKDHIFKSTCRFFDQDQRRCTVYEARPSVCRIYPEDRVCGYYQFLAFERAQQGDDEFIPAA
jgi:Fe-S-cluster containining protein